MRSVFIASHQPSLYMPRLPMVSKYCCVRCSGAAPSVSDAANEDPCIGSWSMPSTVVGLGDAGDLEDGGSEIDDVGELGAQPAAVRMRSGQCTTIGLRVPPRCEPTCLPHWNGVFPAHAHAAE